MGNCSWAAAQLQTQVVMHSIPQWELCSSAASVSWKISPHRWSNCHFISLFPLLISFWYFAFWWTKGFQDSLNWFSFWFFSVMHVQFTVSIQWWVGTTLGKGLHTHTHTHVHKSLHLWFVCQISRVAWQQIQMLYTSPACNNTWRRLYSANINLLVVV